ncbi:mitochondrial 54s ribosomal protein 31 [Diaporthe amygdali]|uniref:mitochondrial 54s ribosomal protein 31 n=1 Tax=Phomopsis amygdali TaxID=1214568 RepID=UPI0022FF1567|nr:mitochondrial 54s ribosomal protein 31 [Diaporthe amygdali]KAJ0104349.1 mitochondrial 54s ribosomal protein 31 [Diaporthe amygdali]
MFGPFRFTNPLSSGLLWKTPWRLSKFQKRRQRFRLRAVDSVVATIDGALAKKGETTKSVERWKAEMPKEEEMRAKDKYTIFDRKEKRYRKGIHRDPRLLDEYMRGKRSAEPGKNHEEA